MTANTPETALITGASSGIGYELAKIFARNGHRLVLVARSQSRLLEIAEELRKMGSPGVTIFAKDLATLEAPDEVLADTQRFGLTVDVLVNNAGFGTHGPFADADLDTELDMMQLNIIALTHLTRLYLPQMLKRGRGRVLNVASTAAFFPGPFMAVYYASKAFVLSFSEALSEEVRKTGVTVTCLCPGATVTGFAQRAKMQESKIFRDTGNLMDAKTVAEMGYRGLMRGEAVVVTGWKNRVGVQMGRLAPRSMLRKLVRKLQEGRKPA